MHLKLQTPVLRTVSFFRSALIATVLATTSVTASAQVVLSNLNENWVGNLVAYGSYQTATAFTVGDASPAYSLTAVTIQTELYSPGGGFYLALYSDDNGSVGSSLEVLLGTDAPLSGTYTYTSSGFTLAANSTYWLLAGSVGDGQYGWAASDTAPEGEWSADDLSLTSLDAGVSWTSFGTYYARYSMEATAVPEPSTYAAIFGCLALGGTMLWRRRKQA